jgi:hypothetical protein
LANGFPKESINRSEEWGGVRLTFVSQPDHTGLTLTDEQRTIAQYWNDGVRVTGTSNGHWMAIVGQMARNDGLSLAAAAEAYARVGIVVTDAFITIWDAKYLYNLQRPVTYIQDHIDGSWLPLILTPPNPS